MNTLSTPTTDLALHDLLDHYATLRDTILGLTQEKDTLAQQIKAALQDGQTAQTELYRAELRPSYSTSYPLAAFRDTFGDAATLEVSDINPKRVDELVKAGELDAGKVQGLRSQRVKSVALVLIPLEQG